MSTTTPLKDRLVAPAQLKLWEREYASLGKQVAKIEAQRSVIMTMIEAARSLTPRDDKLVAPIARKRRRAPARRRPQRSRAGKAEATVSAAAATEQPIRRRPEKSEWKKIVREIALTADHPVPYREAREEIKKTPLGPLLEQSDKGFFYAIRKLSQANEIATYKGHLFAPQLFAKFKADLAAGHVRDLRVENAAHYSPMGEATKEFMRTRSRGATSGNMIWELRKNPEFVRVIDKNKTHPYNVFSTLVRKGDLVKRNGRYFSTELQSGAPSGKSTEGASTSSGEGGASPIESREGGPTTLFG